jgi:hypothetical protein
MFDCLDSFPEIKDVVSRYFSKKVARCGARGSILAKAPITPLLWIFPSVVSTHFAHESAKTSSKCVKSFNVN